ncbi:MAG: phosphate uptake regulator PhoU [Candidatus Bathyarchaeia archaeon]
MREKDLGHRRVQCTGRGSYIISLPKRWVHDVGLKKGSEIAFKVLDDSSLMLIPRKETEGGKETEESRLREYWVLLESKEDLGSVCRKVKSLYVAGAELIRIRFKGKDNVSKLKTVINNLVRDTLLGSEIIDETPNEFVIQILIKHPEFPVEKAIRRMAIVALSAHRDAILTLKNMDEGLVQNVMNAYNDVNRLNLYVVRQLKFGVERNLFRELGFKTPKEFLAYRIVVNDVRSIAENARNIVNNIIAFRKMVKSQTLFLKEPIDEEVYSQILNFNSLAHKLFEESIRATFKWDYNQADNIISQTESLATLENDIINLISSKKLDPNISAIFRLIFDSSRRIMEYSQNIAEVTLNKTVEEISSVQTSETSIY